MGFAWENNPVPVQKVLKCGWYDSHTEYVQPFFSPPQPEVLDLYEWLRLCNTAGKILSLDPCCRYLLHFLHTWYFHFLQWEFHMLNNEEIFAFWISALFMHLLILTWAEFLLTLILLVGCPLDLNPWFVELVNGILMARVSNDCHTTFLVLPTTKLSSEVRWCSSFWKINSSQLVTDFALARRAVHPLMSLSFELWIQSGSWGINSFMMVICGMFSGSVY